MYTQNMGPPDPGRFMDRYVSWEFATQANKWQGRNVCRWRDDEYDRLYRAADVELDPVKRVALFIRLNEILIENRVIVPIVNRPTVAALSNRLKAEMTGWDNDVFLLKDWYRT